MAGGKGKQAANRRENGQFDKGNGEGSKFKKGDARINRNGRPKDLKQLRTLIQKTGFEDSEVKPELSRLQAMIRRMYVSPQSADRKEILRYGWGEPPQTVNVKIEDVDRAIADELARLAGRSQVKDAGAAEADADADSDQAAA